MITAGLMAFLIWEMWSENNLLLRRQSESPSGNRLWEYSTEDDILAFQEEPGVSTEGDTEE